MPSLRTMYFYGDTPSNEAMGWFKEYPNLTHLALINCMLNEPGLARLKEVRQLRLLEIGAVCTTEDVVKRLAEGMPWCEIHYRDFIKRLPPTIFNAGKAGDIKPT